jgi:redox-sensitive bicupin YhaK (pirin superfamily)
VTYVLQGNIDHEDFTGASGSISQGDLQFMTAGRGIMHAEMPRISPNGEEPVGLQLWVDLPKRLKHTEPRYRDLRSSDIPIVHPDENVEIKVISGSSHGVESVKDFDIHSCVDF